LIKLAMVSVDQQIRKKKLKSCMIIQVHDELVLDVPKDEVDTVTSLVKKAMSEVVSYRVPLDVDVVVGKNWGIKG